MVETKNKINEDTFVVSAPLKDQVINWFETEHNIHISRSWYDDDSTPSRWMYHVEKIYCPDFETAIDEAINLIKK
jgi:hypothetical protein